MDSQRLGDIASVLALVMFPACADDSATDGSSEVGTAVGSTTASEAGTATSADGLTTGDETTPGETTSDGSSSATSTGLGDSSSDDATSNATNDESSEETAGTGGQVGALCEAYAANFENCYPDRVDPVELGAQCEMTFDEYAVHGQDCLAAAEALYMCWAEASCQELERDSCFPFVNVVVGECG